jgi:hypothetical protein
MTTTTSTTYLDSGIVDSGVADGGTYAPALECPVTCTGNTASADCTTQVGGFTVAEMYSLTLSGTTGTGTETFHETTSDGGASLDCSYTITLMKE